VNHEQLSHLHAAYRAYALLPASERIQSQVELNLLQMIRASLGSRSIAMKYRWRDLKLIG